jgi:putative toxin-antitoxin system antitoxin component (TIGR02293 family)
MTVRVTRSAAEAMTTGGDARIRLDPATGLNRYFSAPRPRDILAYASSTANDISPAAYAEAERVFAEIGPDPSSETYATRLEALRGRIRAAYKLSEDIAIVLAPSGTDLEYVALASIAGLAPGGTHSVLLGADEVGSGCIYSAHGLYFSDETALAVRVRPGEPVPGLGGASVDLIDVPVRDRMGRVRPSNYIAERLRASTAAAHAANRHSLVHVVHGSKTGLILPNLAEVEHLAAAFEGAMTLVVDACQARITSAAINDYLRRDAIVFVTGSKFMGGPPFSGFALIPPALGEAPPSLPEGFATLFRRAEWPAGWPGADTLPDSTNVGLLLRLEASIFELERFQRLPVEKAERVILAFHAAIRAEIVEKTPARRVAPYPPGHVEDADTHPIEMRSLSTLDLTAFLKGGASLEDAQAWHKAMALAGVRVGQPVRCVRLSDGRWGATLRIGLAMNQIVDAAELHDEALAGHFAADMTAIREALAAASQGLLSFENKPTEEVRIAALLGGPDILMRSTTTFGDMRELVAHGLPRRALSHLVGQVPLLQRPDALENAIGSGQLALEPAEEREVSDFLSPEQSGRAWKFAEILSKATTVFGSQDEAEQWLDSPAVGLNLSRPIELLTTRAGAELVEQYLGKIEFGVYA